MSKSVLPLRAISESVVLLQLGAVLTSEALRPCYHRRPCGCVRSELQPEALLMSIGLAAFGGHIGKGGLCSHLRVKLTSMVLAASKGLVWAHGPAATEGREERERQVRGLCSCQKTCGSPWSMLQLTGKSSRLLIR